MGPGSGDSDTGGRATPASPGAGSSKTEAWVEPERRELQAAPGAGKGRAELGFLEQRRKLCPFLEVAEAGHREKRMGHGCNCCQVKARLSSRTQTLETPMPRPQDIDGQGPRPWALGLSSAAPPCVWFGDLQWNSLVWVSRVVLFVCLF